VFCPNCGTQNDSAATPCKKCGFKLSGISVPKFKGTMMLNSDQTVQGMIDEHRRNQQAGAALEGNKGRASEPPPARLPSSPPPARLPSTPPGAGSSQRGAVLQPPRAAVGSSKRRMGGTMLGVAPQAGGFAPPQVPVTAPVPQVPSVEASRNEAPEPLATGSVPPAAPDDGPADPLAGTYRMPSVEPPAPEAAPAAVEEPAPAPRPTQPLAAAAEAAAPEVARGRPLAATAPLPAQPDRVAARSADSAAPSSAARPLRPLDIVLLICTLGLYGLVLRARRKKQLPAHAAESRV